MGGGRIGLGLATVWLMFPPNAQAASPRVYKDPFRQSPVRGDPGDLMLIAGAGFSAGDKVVYRRVFDSTQLLVHPWTIPHQSHAQNGIAPIVTFENIPDSLTVRLPVVMEKGATYAFWVVNAAREWSDPVLINDARPLWITPDVVYSQESAPGLSRQVKIVGRNLEPSKNTTKVRLRGPKTYIVDALNDNDPTTAIERYVARIVLPNVVRPGTYQIDVRRGGEAWVPLLGQTLTVEPDPAPKPHFPISAHGCQPDDGIDDTDCFVQAIEIADAGGGGVVVVEPGTWELLNPMVPGVDFTYGIELPEGVDLEGSGISSTTIVKSAGWNESNGMLDYRAVFTVLGKNIIRGIRFEDARAHQPEDFTAPFFLLGKFPWFADAGPTRIDDVTFTENVFAWPYVAIGDGGFPLRHLVVTHNEFGAYHDGILLGGNRYIPDFDFRVDDSIISNNVFKPGGYVEPCIYQGTIATHVGASSHLDFSGNVADGHARDYLEGAPPGWRAAFFWHMNGNHEMMLVSENIATCTGDKAGDGEAIAYDNNANTFGFDVAKSVIAANATTVKISSTDGYALQALQNGRPVPANYYEGHWIQIANGPGLGQTRKIIASQTDAGGIETTFTISPAWDVVPEPGQSAITIAREFWQVHTVDNTIDMRGCLGSVPNGIGRCNNQNGSKQCGVINLGGMTADSAVEGNVHHEASGILLTPAYSIDDGVNFTASQRFAYFVDIRNNVVSGEADYDSTCSWAGISLWHGAASGSPNAMPPSPVVLGYGVTVAHNVISQADGIRGGAIVFADTWWEPLGSRMYLNTLIYRNEIRDLFPPAAPTTFSIDACAGSFVCGDNPIREVGIHIRLPLVYATVIADNVFSNVSIPFLDNGTKTVHVF